MSPWCTWLSYASAGIGFVAAAVWLAAAFFRLRYVTTKQHTGVSNVGVNYNIKQLNRQSVLNFVAAFLTAASVGLQALATYCSAHCCECVNRPAAELSFALLS
jgi:hypothetical protein